MTIPETAIWIVVRALLGIFLPVVLLGVTWVMSRLFLQYVALEETIIYLTQSVIIGIPAGIGAVVAWWNLEAPARVRAVHRDYLSLRQLPSVLGSPLRFAASIPTTACSAARTAFPS